MSARATASLSRGLVCCVVAGVIASCAPASTGETTLSASPDSSAASSPGGSASASASGSASAPTNDSTAPPVQPGRARGAVVVVQRGEDASLVAGGDPIRLTIARTQNEASWIASPPQGITGTMTTEEALLALGWRPSDDGTTAPLPAPQPNGLLASAGGDLAFTLTSANVRADGTLVLDITPLAAPPPEGLSTVESFGPVSLTLDGIPGVLVEEVPVAGDITARILVLGGRTDEAVVQLVDGAGEILASEFVAGDLGSSYPLDDVETETTRVTAATVEFVPPAQGKPGSATIVAEATVDGAAAELRVTVARWSAPL
ncbi:MAG: hypothetical protein ACKOT0_06475 [bacterium]